MTTPKDLNDILSDFESRDSFGEAEIYDSINKLKADDTFTFEELSELMAFGFCENYPHPMQGWGKYYGPMMTFSNGDGTGTESPSIRRVTPEMMAYWRKRSLGATNSLMKSRYLDLIIDFHKIILEKPVDVTLVKELISENIAVARNRLHKYDYNAKLKLERALELSLSYNLKEEIEKCKTAILDLEKRIGDDSKGGTWGFSYDLLIENPKIELSADIESGIIKELEERLDRLSSGSNNTKADPWAAEKAATRLANYYRKNGRTQDVPSAIKKIANAFELILHDGSPLQISGWLDHLQKIYRSYGMMEEAEKVLVKIREIGPKVNDDLKTISHRFTLPQAEIDKFVSGMLEGDLDTVLQRIAVHFIPDKSREKEKMLELSKTAPLMFLATLQIQDKKGRVIAKVGSIEDDLEGNIVRQISESLTFSSIFLALVLEKVIEKYKVEDIMSFIKKGPLIQEPRFDIIEKGIGYYYEKNYLVAIHLLVPQVEEAIRNLLEFSGGSVLKQSKGGGYHLRTFDEVLRDEIIIRTLGENPALYFRILFTDQRGLNIRNDVSHGILDPSDFSKNVCDRVVHSVLCLALLRKVD